MGERLAGKVAVVIGGATGLGLAAAERFAAEGATVVVAGRRADLADEVGTRLGGWGAACDVGDHDSVAELAAAVLARHGTIDVGLNSAGYAESVAIVDMSAAQLEAMVRVQLVGAVYAIKHLAGAMAETGGGSMLNISSLTAQNPVAGQAAYAGAKAAVEYISKIAAVELGPKGVRVNCVAAHLIETPMTAPIFSMPLVVEAMRLQTPAGFLGVPADVANALLFLASDEARYINGETIRVDGGAHTQKLPSDFDYAMLATTRPELLG
jgi:NAD(P)-dependent dehydrogenase (short-subunit alcohol dehydrogenase family)